MTFNLREIVAGLFFMATLTLASVVNSAELADTIQKIKPSIVGIGTYSVNNRPAASLKGTGFVVLDGQYVITNAHVIPDSLDHQHKEYLVLFSGTGNRPDIRKIKLLERDKVHDLALLKIVEGKPLPAMKIGVSDKVREGEKYAFTGFPIGAILGLYPVTHEGIVSSITPIAVPQVSARSIDASMLKRLRDPYTVFQLDATAYPGNSGSPLYHSGTGKVVGVINKVFVKESKEAILEKPSGISYAIPARYVKELFEKQGLSSK